MTGTATDAAHSVKLVLAGVEVKGYGAGDLLLPGESGLPCIAIRGFVACDLLSSGDSGSSGPFCASVF